MDTLTLFTLEIAICIGISLTVITLLKPLLTDVLQEICGTEKRATFWVMFTQLMIYLTPLLIVVYFSPTSSLSDNSLVLALKDALFRSLLGIFIALASIGQIIWKSINSFVSDQNITTRVEE